MSGAQRVRQTKCAVHLCCRHELERARAMPCRHARTCLYMRQHACTCVYPILGPRDMHAHDAWLASLWPSMAAPVLAVDAASLPWPACLSSCMCLINKPPRKHASPSASTAFKVLFASHLTASLRLILVRFCQIRKCFVCLQLEDQLLSDGARLPSPRLLASPVLLLPRRAAACRTLLSSIGFIFSQALSDSCLAA